MNSIEREWRKLLSKILEEGHMNKKDDSNVLEILGYNTFVECPINNIFSLPDDIDYFLKFIESGWFNIKGYPMNNLGILEYLEGLNDEKIIRCDEREDGFVYSYPERLLSMRIWDIQTDSFQRIDQFQVIIDRLNQNPGTNRAVAHFYNCGIDRNEVDIPCLQFLQATIRDKELILHVIFRSNDIYGAWPANMFFITYIGLMIKDIMSEKIPDLVFAGIDYHVSSAHIYETDLEKARGVLNGSNK